MVFPVRLWATLAVLGGAVAPTMAHADLYYGIALGYSNSESQTEAQSTSDHPLLMQMQVGHFFNDYVALEGRYGQSLERSSGIAVDDMASMLIKGNVPVSERTAIYALTGYSYSAFDISGDSFSSEDISFGLGLHYALSNKSAITLEMINYTTDDKARLASLNLAYQVRF